jgi:GrpB-like predicted nucleotidyltransferase (UPF0157 family)
VHLTEYRSDWPEHFRAAASGLHDVFAGVAHGIEHIGSTAVPGLCAKPVIDILLGVGNLAHVTERIEALGALCYRYRPEYEQELPQRRYFVRAADELPRIHLHAWVHGSAGWTRHLAFRDALRTQPGLAREYAGLKRGLAALHADDKAAYTAAKAPFIRRVDAWLQDADGNDWTRDGPGRAAMPVAPATRSGSE